MLLLPEPTEEQGWLPCFVEWLLLPFDLIVALLTVGAGYYYVVLATGIFCLILVSDDVRYLFFCAEDADVVLSTVSTAGAA